MEQMRIPDESKEGQQFKPEVIFDFIRHGQAEYGEELKQKMDEIGYKFEEHLPTSRISQDKLEGSEIYEGKVTEEGAQQLRQAVSGLIERINPEKEKLAVLFGPRFRTVDSSRIVLEELEELGVDVVKARSHKDLIDMKKHWLAVLEFVSVKTGKADAPWKYWLDMSEEELKEADLEGVRDIGERMDHFIRLVQRYRRRYKDKLGLDEKILRVIAVTHDVNILSALEGEVLGSAQLNLIKNAQIVELGSDEDGNLKLMLGGGASNK